jgi:hypothetical protein
MKASEIFKSGSLLSLILLKRILKNWTKSNNTGTDISRNYLSIQTDGSGFNCKIRPAMSLFGNFSVYPFCFHGNFFKKLDGRHRS